MSNDSIERTEVAVVPLALLRSLTRAIPQIPIIPIATYAKIRVMDTGKYCHQIIIKLFQGEKDFNEIIIENVSPSYCEIICTNSKTDTGEKILIIDVKSLFQKIRTMILKHNICVNHDICWDFEAECHHTDTEEQCYVFKCNFSCQGFDPTHFEFSKQTQECGKFKDDEFKFVFQAIKQNQTVLDYVNRKYITEQMMRAAISM